MYGKRSAWRIAAARGMAALLAVMTVLQLRSAYAEPGDIFTLPAPAIGSDPPKAADIQDGDVSVSTSTGALNYSYKIKVPPGRNGMSPQLALTYSSQGPTYGGIAAGWNWNLSIPEIKEDTSQGRLRTHYPYFEQNQADPTVDDRFVSTMAGGRPLVLIDGDTTSYHYRAQNDATFARYERMKPAAQVPYRWRVFTTDGTIRYFGDPANDKCPHTSDGFAPLTSEVDPFGNQIDYTWDNGAPDECVISKIEWGKNVSAGLGHFAQVIFQWTAPNSCQGVFAGSFVDYRTGTRIVTGASKLTRITATAFAPGGPVEHTRQIDLGYDTTVEGCSQQHAPLKELTSIIESAWGVNSPLVTLPTKRFHYNSATTFLSAPPSPTVAPWFSGISAHEDNLAWGYRRTDDRWPTVEAMMLDVDGDGLQDRILNLSKSPDGNTHECTAFWQKNLGLDPSSGRVHFETTSPEAMEHPETRTIHLPRLKWRGPGLGTEPYEGSTYAGADHFEGCALNGQVTAYRNSDEQFDGNCHDDTQCQHDTSMQRSFCQMGWTNCPPGDGGPGGPHPNDTEFRTYLAYRWMDMDADGLVDLVAAVHGDIDVYDIERGNHPGYEGPNDSTTGEPSISGIPGAGEWPACPDEYSTCLDVDAGEHTSCDGVHECSTNWSVVNSAINAAPAVGCAKFLLSPGPALPGGGSAPIRPKRGAYQRCHGLYPWLVYYNRGNGAFDSIATVKYQPVPLESDNGDSSLYGPGIAATYHAVQDFDGDGSLDAVVHPADHVQQPNADHWQVFLGDRTGQFGLGAYYFPTRTDGVSFLSAIGVSDATFAKSYAGLIDFNGDGLPDHWRAVDQPNPADTFSNIAMHEGDHLQLLSPAGDGFVNTPLTLKTGTDSTFLVTLQSPSGYLKGHAQIERRIVDVDGDGRVDLVKWDGSNATAYLNLGGQFPSSGVTYPGDPRGVERQIQAQDDFGPDPLYWELESDVLDLDGDGIAEGHYFEDLSTNYWSSLPSSQPPRLLYEIDNGRGAVTDVTYATMHSLDASGQPVVEQHPEIVENGRPKASPTEQWVVESMVTSDTFSPATAPTTYKYRNPVHKADDSGRFGFRGFEEVTTTAPSGSRTIERYSYSPDWSGRLAETLVMPKLGSGEGDTDVRTIDRTTWEERQLFGGAIRTYHGTVVEHLVCANGQDETACKPSTAPGYTRTTFTLETLAPSTDPTPQLWEETDTLLQSGASTSLADGDRTTTQKFVLVSDANNYRLRPVLTAKTVQELGAPVMYAKSEATWDSTYRVQLTDVLWLTDDVNDAAVSRSEYYATGLLKDHWKPEQNAAGSTHAHYDYDARELFVASETNELGHVTEHTWEYGTGVELTTSGPNSRTCSSCSTDATHPVKEQTKIVVDGLGRMLERWESFSDDGSKYVLTKVETNSYADTPTSAPTSVFHQQLIDTAGTTWKQDKTELDGHGRPIKTTTFVQGSTPADQISTFVYGPAGTLQSVTLPDPSLNSGATVTYSYAFDSLGRPTSIRRPDGSPQSGVDIAYDGQTKTTTEVVGADGGVAAATRTTNDRFGRLEHVEEKFGSGWPMTTYGYGPDDSVVSVTDPEGVITTMAHDFAGHRTGITRSGRTWSFEYDRNGNVFSEVAPGSTGPGTDLFYRTTTAYDDLDRPTSRVIGQRELTLPDQIEFGSDTEVFTYDEDAIGHDANMKGRLRQWSAYDPNSDLSAEMDLTVDAQGNPGGTIETLQIPGEGSLSREVHETWYATGDRKQMRHGDVMGIPNQSSFSTWSTVHLDPRGLPKDIEVEDHSDAGGSTTKTYGRQTRNVAGLVTQRHTTISTGRTGLSVESNWTYDTLGRVADQTVQKIVQPSTITKVAEQTLTYFGNDDPKRLDHYLGTTLTSSTYTYDSRHQLSSARDGSGLNNTYSYGDAGRFSRVHELLDTVHPPAELEMETRNVNYEYQDADPERITALTNVSDGSHYATVAYDASGNMTWKCLGASYAPTCAGESFDFTYDGKDQLRRAVRKVAGAVTGSEEYWYDKDGQRIAVLEKNASGTAVEMIWFLKDTEAHYNGTGDLLFIYSYATMGTPVARIERTSNTTTTTEFQFHGLANNTLAAVSTAGVVNASFRYAPFGQILQWTDGGGRDYGAKSHRRRFNDKEQDLLTSLKYYGARYYDSTLLGWTQGDPEYRFSPDSGWTTPRHANLYVFSGQNPLRYIDPDGRSFVKAIQEIAHNADPSIPAPDYSDKERAFDAAVGRLASLSNPVSALVSRVANEGSASQFVNDVLNPPAAEDPLDVIGDRGTPNGTGDPGKSGGSPRTANTSESATGNEAEATGQKYVGSVPKPRTGPGTVPEEKRDPKRFFGAKDRQEKRKAQGGVCGTGCGKKLNKKNSRGHHIERWADGGKTVKENHVEVCLKCHKKLHE